MSTQVEYIHMSKTEMTMQVNTYDVVFATAIPIDAPNRTLCYESDRPEIVSINSNIGQVRANSIGTANIKVYLESNPCICAICTIKVEGYIPVDSISFPVPELAMDFDKTMSLGVIVKPSNATNPRVIWRSCCPEVASVSSVGIVTAHKPGIVDIYAITEDGNLTAKCEIWVRGKTPVFLIHGRISHSEATWGITTNIPSGKNNHSKPNINADTLDGKKYTDIKTQEIKIILDCDHNDTEKPCNLGYELQRSGYKKKINLFAFNYPNEDAVVHSAKKLSKYIENLISYVRNSGTDEMKTCFYASRYDYNTKNHKINLIGHSMGGLVARYYIENMGYMISYHVGDVGYYEEICYDKHVNKLITICTPHWGSGYGELSSNTGIEHKLCDHDLDFDSAMFGGSNSTTINCSKGTCPENNFSVTPALQHQRQRSTKYYAIAGIDYSSGISNHNDFTFEMPTNFTTMQQIVDYFTEKGIYSFSSTNMSIIEINIKGVGDNMVGFLSQIGWVGDNPSTTPAPRVQMEKIFVDVDTDGGNGGGIFVLEAIMEWLLGDALLHSKIPHRIPVIQKIIQFLGE